MIITYFFFSPDVILCGWLGLKHQLTNKQTYFTSCVEVEYIESK